MLCTSHYVISKGNNVGIARNRWSDQLNAEQYSVKYHLYGKIPVQCGILLPQVSSIQNTKLIQQFYRYFTMYNNPVVIYVHSNLGCLLLPIPQV
ncbi:hypothetical protein GDO86_011205 [Hymenochirus boettgeri]|uniref:Uncharacterized protein n=1 Tax=Hymenochirus boettgeri TaxID=247094 RepID=A0A8T2JFH1_9PIPI|nr:hypothetical protein GDO86_011205 [Hymenochirus boettgeri]